MGCYHSRKIEERKSKERWNNLKIAVIVFLILFVVFIVGMVFAINLLGGGNAVGN